MSGAPTAAVAVAHAVAAAAAMFQCPSGELATRYQGASDLLTVALSAAGGLASPVLPVPGGLPVMQGDQVVAGLGVAGRDPGVSQEIAAAVLAGHGLTAPDGQPQ